MSRKRKKRDTRFSDYSSFFGMLSGGGSAKIRRDSSRDASDIAAGRDLNEQEQHIGMANRQAEVHLPRQSSFEAKLLGAGRAKFSPLGATEILKEEAGSDVASIWDSIENVRTASKAAEHYHNEKIMKEFYTAVGQRPDPMAMSLEQAISGSNLRTEILRMAVDVPSPDAHHVIKRMRQKFNSPVKQAIQGDDQERLIELSAEIADFLNMERHEDYREEGKKPGLDVEGVMAQVKAADKAKRDEIKAAQKSDVDADSIGQPQRRGYSPGGKDAINVLGRSHTFAKVQEVESEPIELGAAVSMVLDETRGAWDKQGGKFKGLPGRDIWRLGMFGDTAVFEENKKTRGKVAIMVDMSGSMGCPCAVCDSQRGRGWQRQYGGSYRNAAWLAWQSAGAIMKAFPESDVYSYSSGGGRCSAWIATNQTGNQPTHDSVSMYMGGGTPTCTGALFLKKVITSDIGASAAVLITDGYPNNSDCTAAVNKGFMRDGLRFANVLIGHDLRNMDKIFPSESSVMINGEDELPNLQETMRFLAEVRQ